LGIVAVDRIVDAKGRMVEKAADQIILPPAGTVRWGSHKKVAVVLGIRAGLITREEAYARYMLSPEELAFWETAFDRGGHKALVNKTLPPRRLLP
jgi:hypothetical protein